MRDGFNYFRAFLEDAIQNENYSEYAYNVSTSFGAGYIPAFVGDVPINYVLYRMERLAQNVTGIKVPL